MASASQRRDLPVRARSGAVRQRRGAPRRRCADDSRCWRAPTPPRARSPPPRRPPPTTMAGADMLGGAADDPRAQCSERLARPTQPAFDGEGTSAQSNQLTGSISVTVAKRLANGNLLVRGQKWITINQGREYVQHPGHRAPDGHRSGQHRALVQRRRRHHRLWRPGHAGGRQYQVLAGAILRFQLDAVLAHGAHSCIRSRVQLCVDRPVSAAGAGAGRARQGPGLGLRRAHQPAGRLRTGGRA